ncbi:MAG: glycerophosphodiester phosphodiesterase, partial [Burkholderiales bacterium]|nr:glycerophosphodiester phosphodiesterase [Anaerolineae bacterium]
LATARAVVAYLQKRNFVRGASIASFDPACLRAVREWEPLLTVNLDPTPQNSSITPWELCQQCLDCGANFMGHTYETLTPSIVHEARLHGLALWAWTVNDVIDMQRMVDLGVDAILSDDPATLKRLLDSD